MNKDEVNAATSINKTLQRLGYVAFRQGQEEAIRQLMAGHDVLVVLPTGSGKSLIYQIAALHKKGTTLVISPLIALMQDQVEKLEQQGVPATFINSSLSAPEENERLELMTKGAYKIIYVTPERLRQKVFHQQVKALDVNLLAVDEAHSISEWGHDFRPDYLHIADFRRFVGNPPTVAVTATATPRVQEEIIALLDLSNVRRVIGGFDRPNITFSVEVVPTAEDSEEAKFALLGNIFARHADTAAIVYVGTRSEAETVAEFLREQHGVAVEPYHAGMGGKKRADIQNKFLSGELPVVAATNAFGMGIDRADVRLVVHYTMPGSLEAYYQEAGRAGRDGEPAEAVLLYDKNDRRLHEHFIRQNELRFRELESLYEEIVAAQETDGSTDTPQVNMRELARDAYLRGGADKARLALEQLEEAGAIEQGLYEGNEVEIEPASWQREAVKQALEQNQVHRHRQSLQLEEMIVYAENILDCRRGMLLKHFGDEAPDEVRAGCCDVCAGKREVAEFVAAIEEESQQSEPPAPPPPLADTIVDCVRAFSGLRTPTQLVDLLHGDEKGYNRFKNSKYHGLLERYRREEIAQEISRMLAEQRLSVNDLERLALPKKQR